MAQPLIQQLLNSSFKGKKSIQRAYQFAVRFNYNPIPGGRLGLQAHKKLGQFETNSPISEWHIKNVVLPQHNFKKESERIGIFPRTFPVYESDGMELRVEMEEDSFHNVSMFIQYLQKRIVSDTGVYEAPGISKLTSIDVDVFERQNVDGKELSEMKKVVSYRFLDCFFLNSSEANYAYATNEAVSYVLTFGCDTYEILYQS